MTRSMLRLGREIILKGLTEDKSHGSRDGGLGGRGKDQEMAKVNIGVSLRLTLCLVVKRDDGLWTLR